MIYPPRCVGIQSKSQQITDATRQHPRLILVGL